MIALAALLLLGAALASAQSLTMLRQARACGMLYVDLNGDGRVEASEIARVRQAAIDYKFGGGAPVVHAIAWFSSFLPQNVRLETVDDVIRNCAGDDGYITAESYAVRGATCLNTQEKVREAIEFVCEPGRAMVFEELRTAPLSAEAKEAQTVLDARDEI